MRTDVSTQPSLVEARNKETLRLRPHRSRLA